ncbi:anti-sigma factor [Accumulibacter sp.]|uniref:anti-sigma factor family protein n=1 Tax=Accumulibacter sp. TaxID=2053492 RepID=UPI0028C3AADF|nr:anti-sigma factor [Accumulibacter sp.]
MNKPAITEADLHAYVDGALSDARLAEVQAYLATRPQEAERVQAYRQQNEALHRLFDPVLDEALPERLRVPSPARWRFAPLRQAAVLAWIALGGLIGWQLGSMQHAATNKHATLAQRAAIAHVVYSPEVRHPVEVGADQETHLVNWLSKRLGTQLSVPQLGELGYSLVGGRLLPGDDGPVALFMYQDEKGRRLTLYVRTGAEDGSETAFRFARENGVSVFYWLDGKLGYALSAEIDKAELLRVANALYRQLNP